MAMPTEQDVLDAVERLALRGDGRHSPVSFHEVPTALKPFPREPNDVETLLVIRRLMVLKELQLAGPDKVRLPQ